jgi:hypothetical protein
LPQEPQFASSLDVSAQPVAQSVVPMEQPPSSTVSGGSDPSHAAPSMAAVSANSALSALSALDGVACLMRVIVDPSKALALGSSHQQVLSEC